MSTKSRFLIGLILVAAGIYLLLNNFNIVPFSLPSYFFSWQALLILIGLIIVGTREQKGGGITLIIVGVVFLIPEVFDVSWEDLLLFWPLVFVFIGLSILLRRGREKKTTDHAVAPLQATDYTDYIDEDATFSSSYRQVVSDSFRGGRVTAIFGSARIDLTQARLSEGRYELDIFVLFGSVELRVPNDWNISNQASTVLGGLFDKRKYHVPYDPQASRQLLLKGNVIVGSGELRSP